MKATLTPSRSIQFQFPAIQTLGQTLERLWDSALTYFATSAEPTVHYVKTAGDRSQWIAYDPTTQQSVTIDSELEMRVWLENRYYGSPVN